MHRRAALIGLCGAVVLGRDFLENAFNGERGTGVLLDLRAKTILGAHRSDVAKQWLIPPGSTLKPFSLTALLRSGKLNATETFSCPRELLIGGRSYSCRHPPIASVTAASAIAYSCNCFVAHMARRFETGELARFLLREKLASRSALLGRDEAAGEVDQAADLDSRELQAIGERCILVTPAGLLAAYAALAATAPEAVIEGLEGAVEYGTAQLAAVPGVKVAGKTGTVVTANGARAAWFAGFAPSRAPLVAIVAVVQGQSGGLDAAPIAGRALTRYFEARH